ncbi:MAG: hypothetical protein ABI581_11785 [Sediminibacterium sp.]
MKNIYRIICKFKNRPALLLIFGVLLLFILYLLRKWLVVFFLLYLAMLLLFGLIGLVRLLQARLRKKCWEIGAGPKGSGSEGHPASRPVYVPAHTYKRPDPMIYSQHYLMSKGLAVTWDNPDIQLFDGNIAVSSNEVLPGKTYTVRARVWNGSVDAPAVNVEARFSYLSFGVGSKREEIGKALVKELPIKGSPKLPSFVEHTWKTPSTPGHYCIQIELIWEDDANHQNNLGQENINVKKLNSPNASFQFMLRNDSVFSRRFLLQADTYTLPDKQCWPEDTPITRPRESDQYILHRIERYPTPDGWQILYFPGNEVLLEPGDELPITVKITAADDFVGRKAININAFDDDRQLVGGVTLYVHS